MHNKYEPKLNPNEIPPQDNFFQIHGRCQVPGLGCTVNELYHAFRERHEFELAEEIKSEEEQQLELNLADRSDSDRSLNLDKSDRSLKLSDRDQREIESIMEKAVELPVADSDSSLTKAFAENPEAFVFTIRDDKLPDGSLIYKVDTIYNARHTNEVTKEVYTFKTLTETDNFFATVRTNSRVYGENPVIKQVLDSNDVRDIG